MTTDHTSPIDEVHRISVEMISRIREDVARIRAGIEAWEPAPFPEPVSHPHATIESERPFPPHGADSDTLYRQRHPYFDEIDRPQLWLR